MLTKKYSHYIMFVALFGFALFLRVYKISEQSYWVDEMVSLYFASRDSWFDIFKDNHPFLYHLLLKVWIMVFNTSESSTRLLSVMLSMINFIIVYKFLTRTAKDKILVYAGCIVYAVSCFSIIYAQEARMYALFEFTTTLCFYNFYKLYFLKEKNEKSYFISCVLLCLTHYASLIILTFQLGVILLSKKQYKIKTLFLILCAIAMTLLSYLYIFSWPHLEWQKLKFVQEPMAQTPLQALLYISNFSYFILSIYIITYFLAYLKMRKISFNKNAVIFYVWFVVFSIGLLFSASLIFQRALMLPRYLIFLNTIFIISFIYSLTLFSKKIKYVVLSLFIGISVFNLPKAYLNIKAPWRELATHIKQYAPGIILTTRTLAIAVPYLDKHIRAIKLFNPEAVDLKPLFNDVENVWVIENYWGGSIYIERFKENLKLRRYSVEEFKFQTPYSEPLTALRITLQN